MILKILRWLTFIPISSLLSGGTAWIVYAYMEKMWRFESLAFGFSYVISAGMLILVASFLSPKTMVGFIVSGLIVFVTTIYFLFWNPYDQILIFRMKKTFNRVELRKLIINKMIDRNGFKTQKIFKEESKR